MKRKSANNVGAMVRQELDRIDRDVPPGLKDQSDEKARAFADLVATALKEGRGYEQECRDVVHEERSFSQVDWPTVRQWVRDAQGMTGFFRLSPEQQQRVMRS